MDLMEWNLEEMINTILIINETNRRDLDQVRNYKEYMNLHEI